MSSTSYLLSARAVCLALTLGLAAGSVHALPPGFTEQPVGTGWSEVVGLTFAEDGRMFVWERSGRIWNVDGGVKSSQPLIDISEEVGGWRDYGLLGVALHPDFYSNGYIYLLYVVDHHHLIHHGTASYDPAANEYFMATIGRITRYTARAGDDFRTVDPSSRLVLLGESIDTGFPILHQSHGVGGLIFGTDGTLLASCGDGASYSAVDTGGDVGGTYASQALAEGIIDARQNVGAYRSQLPDSLNGKIIRIDPTTGDGVPSNPLFDGAAPRSARSRLWALGLRNPCRIALRPGTGSHDPADADPGSITIGDVGWSTWEDLHVANRPGQNFGWPAFEGMEAHGQYWNSDTPNYDAPNPLFGVGGCTQQYFFFRDLIQQDTLDPNPSFPNPCDTSQEIPASIPRFVHSRPVIDWRHGSGPSRTSIYNGNDAATINIGAAGSPVAGPQFGGNCSMGGVWYTGTDFPEEYRNTYFHSDYGAQWIRNFVFDANDRPVEVRDFTTGRPVVAMATHPIEGALYYVSWSSQVWKITYTPSGNQPPTAAASLDVAYGPAPLAVQFDGSASTDPEGLALGFEWDFGDGSATSSAVSPLHVFDAPAGVPTRYDVTLTVTDSGGLASVATLLVSVNNSPPQVTITSPLDGTLYPMDGDSIYDLRASVTDVEHAGAELSCSWQTYLHHNNHFHEEPEDPACDTTTVISPIGCNGETYFYRIVCRVTDAAGLSGSDEVILLPDCPNVTPVARDDSATVAQGYEVAIDVLANDSDPDGSIDPATVEVFNPPAAGSTDVDPVTGVITYTHDGGPATSDSFTYTVKDNGGATSNAAAVSITAFNNPPSVSITSPADRHAFADGEMIQLRADAMDPEDGAGVAQHWEIQLIHNDHLHLELFVWDGPTPPDYVLDGAPDVAAGDRISYLVQVTVTDVAGATAVDTARLVPAVEPPNGLPVAAAAATPVTGTPPLQVDFDAAGSSDPDGDFLLFEWDFGDGATGSGESTSHVYGDAGIFTATVTVIDAIGKTDTETVIIEVTSPGLEGTYFDNMDLTAPVLTRIDPTIDFDWGSGSPDPSIGADTFSARWLGTVEPIYTETYTFHALTDDGFRLWIDDQPVIDSWVDQAPTERSGSIALTAGTRHALRVEYYENGGGAVARLSWSSPSQPKEIVPAERLAPPQPNAPPVADTILATTVEDSPTAIALSGSDPDGDPLSYAVLTQPASGSLAGTAPNLVYTPDPDFAGEDSFDFEVSDGLAADTGTVTVTVTPVNDAPVALGQTITGEEDSLVAITLQATDADGDALVFTVLRAPANGSLSGTAPDLIYSPDPDYHGPDSLDFEVSDGQLEDVAVVDISVQPVNDPPVSAGQAVATEEDTSVPISLSATDIDGDPLTYSIVTGPTSGSLAGAAPDLVYTPDPDFAGGDSFTFRASDGQASDTAAVSITVSPVNDAPVALDQSVETEKDVAVGMTLSATDVDGDPLGYTILTPPANGLLSGVAPDLTYTPSPGYSGPDSFTFSASDGPSDSNVATVSITVLAGPAPDVIVVDRAFYHSKKQELNVRATSSRQPDVTLTVRVSVGGVERVYPLPFESKKGRYEATFGGLGQPDSTFLTVESSGGGAVTVEITMR